jgi:hypothetical protein
VRYGFAVDIGDAEHTAERTTRLLDHDEAKKIFAAALA